MGEIIIEVMANGMLRGTGPGSFELISCLVRFFELKGITSVEEKIAEIARLAPTAKSMRTQ